MRIIYSMIDLLSCAFAGAIFLFLLVVSTRSVPVAAPPVVAEQAYIKLSTETPGKLPILVLWPPGEQRRPRATPYFLRPNLMQTNGLSRVEINAPGTHNGSFVVHGEAAWMDAGSPDLRSLILEIRKPRDGHWCIGAVLSDTQEGFAKHTTVQEPVTVTVIVSAAGGRTGLPPRAKTIRVSDSIARFGSAFGAVEMTKPGPFQDSCG